MNSIIKINSIPNEINNVIDNFVKQVYELLGNRVKKIILYGSYARGDYNSHSDIDIMVLADLSFEEIEKYRDELAGIAFDIELETGLMISLIVKNIDKYNRRINIIPFYYNVTNEGVVLSNG